MKKAGLFLLLISNLLNWNLIEAAPSLEDYGHLPEIQQVAVSPNGDLIAYRHVSGSRDFIFVISLSQGKRLAALDVSSVKPRFVKFLNNKQVFLQASEHTRVAGFKGKLEVSTGFAMNVDDAKVKQLLIPGDGVVYPGQTGLGHIVGISPDGKYAYMPAYFGEPTIVMGKWADPSYALLRVRLDSFGKPKKQRGGRSESIDFFVDTKGDAIVREDFDESDHLHKVFSKVEKKWIEIFREETEYPKSNFAGLTPDKKYLVVLDGNKETGRTAYYTMALQDGKVDGPFYDRNDADIIGVIDDIQRVVHGVKYSGMTPTYKFFDSKLDARVKAIQSSFADHSVYIVDNSPDWKYIVVRVEGSQAPGDYYLFEEGKKPVFIASQRPKIGIEDIHPTGTITFTARDGLKIPTILTIPRNRVEDMKNLPAVVLPHGGPASFDQIEFDYLAQALAQQGYMVIKPQFRGSAGFGRDHKLAGHGEWGGKMQDDLSDAVKFFAKQGLIDPNHVCIVGGSYGGYAALAGGAFTPELYKCVVSINGIGDLKDFHSWIRNERGRSSASLAYWEEQIGNGDYSTEDAVARSPKYSAAKFTAPVLLIHGKDDEVVPIRQSKFMLKALKSADKKVQFIELDGDDHYLSESKTRLQTLKATVDFVNQNI